MDQPYDWDFVDPPQQEFYCPLCKKLLNEPKLTECCGKNFCTKCIDLEKPCPNPECDEEHFVAIFDRRTKKKIEELDVLCPLKGRGCHWKGEMSARAEHLDLNNQNGCKYLDIKCTNGCGEEMERYELAEHLEKFCHRRPYTCKHCGTENVFEVITNHHIPECPAYPITCENNCGFDGITRSTYPEHLLKCPEQEIDCEFQYVGCKERFKRKDSGQHQREGVYIHLSLQTAFATQQLSERDKKIEEMSTAWENKHQQVVQEIETLSVQSKEQEKNLKLEIAQKDESIAHLNEHLKNKDHVIEDLQQSLKNMEEKVETQQENLTKAKDASTQLKQTLQNQAAELQDTKLKTNQLSVQLVEKETAIKESIKQQVKETEAKLLESQKQSTEVSRHSLNELKIEVNTTADDIKKTLLEVNERYTRLNEQVKTNNKVIESLQQFLKDREVGISAGAQQENPDESLELYDEVPASAKHIKKPVPTIDQSVYDNMSPDALSLLEKIPAGKINGVHYNSRAGRILIDKETPEKENERITTFQTEYQALLKKMKTTQVPIPATTSLDIVSELVDAYNNQYNLCVFTIQERCVKILSSSSRQCDQAVTLLTEKIIGKREVIQLLNGRTLTLKKANIVEEKVYIIVNPVNDSLSHAGGVAAALDRATKGKLQKICDNHIRRKGKVNVGCIAITSGAGGDLKCNKVIHAVGPRYSLYHKDAYYEHCLQSVVQETLKGAEKYDAKSIAFPAISTGIFGVKKELVARCLIDTIVAYKFSKPHPVLCDIRIVIIDDATYDPFALYCQQKQKELTSPVKPAKFTPSKKSIDPSASTATAKPTPSAALDKQLSLRDTSEIETALKGLANEWRLLGTKLGFSMKILGKIGSISADASVYLNRLLVCWLSGDAGSPTTVTKLIEAVGGMKGKEDHSAAFNDDDPLASATPHAGDSNDSPGNNHNASIATAAADKLVGISYPKDDPMDGSTGVDNEPTGGVTGATSFSGNSQDENKQDPLLASNPASTLSSSLCGTTTALTSTVTTTTTSPSVVPSPPPGLSNQPAVLSGYNDGQPYRYTDEPMTSQGGGMNDPKLQFAFKGRGQARLEDSTQPSKTPKGRGMSPHTMAAKTPLSYDFEASQSRGGGATGMNYSGAVAKQNSGAGIVTTQPQAASGHTGHNSTAKDNKDHSKQEKDECPICISEYTDPVKTKCGHVFCRGCIDLSLQHSSFCPICKCALKTIVGNQPSNGQMTVQYYQRSLPGYNDCGTIEIHYFFPNGTQTREHPNPGQRYSGTA